MLGVQRAMQMEHIEIKTVDGFEGREKEVIIFSTVRNNEEGHIGFLADKKRLNVGLTRAKRGLFVLGSISTIRAGKPEYDDGYGDTVSISKGYIEPSIKKQELKDAKKKSRGHESWRRYAQFVVEKNWVVSLQGKKLEHVLYGHWNALQNEREAEALAEIRHAGWNNPSQPILLRG